MSMNARILSATRRPRLRAFRWQQEEPTRDEHGRFASDAEPAPFQGADGGARGPEPEAEPLSMNDMISGASMARRDEQVSWARHVQKTRPSEQGWPREP